MKKIGLTLGAIGISISTTFFVTSCKSNKDLLTNPIQTHNQTNQGLTLKQKEYINNINNGKLTTIPNNAFQNLTSLPMKIDFSQVKHIGQNAFYYLISLPNDVDFSNLAIIGKHAFHSLTSLPNDVDFSNLKSIGVSAFYHITSLPIGSVFPWTLLDDMLKKAFPRILKDWIITHKNPSLKQQEMINKINNGTQTTIPTNAFTSLTTLPDGIDFSKIITIEKGAFYSLTSLPSGIDFSNLTKIGNEAFASLHSLPDGIDFSNLTTIGKEAFKNLMSLPKMEMDFSNLTKIGDLAFKSLIFLMLFQ